MEIAKIIEKGLNQKKVVKIGQIVNFAKNAENGRFRAKKGHFRAKMGKNGQKMAKIGEKHENWGLESRKMSKNTLVFGQKRTKKGKKDALRAVFVARHTI